TGTLDISGSIKGPHVEICWTEQGGPPLDTAPKMAGYGSTLVEQTIEGQLGGSVGYDWSDSGAVIKLTISRDCLSA
ncbi:MAG: hypothetical protein ACK4YU_01065, partial [Paracoccus sp. (in: a-proteobacteria)]